MRKTFFLLVAAIAPPVLAGDLWEITSSAQGPDGTQLTQTETKCLPGDGMIPSQMLGDMGSCTFDQKSGDAAAMTFTMTCRTPGMPADLGAVKVSGDAKLNGGTVDMRYTVTPGGSESTPAGDFRMTGSAQARKVGQCDGR